jgi:hypothetical protein
MVFGFLEVEDSKSEKCVTWLNELLLTSRDPRERSNLRGTEVRKYSTRFGASAFVSPSASLSGSGLRLLTNLNTMNEDRRDR